MFLSCIILVDNIPGTLHPKLFIIGIKEFPFKPIYFIILSIKNIPLERYPHSFSINIEVYIENICTAHVNIDSNVTYTKLFKKYFIDTLSIIELIIMNNLDSKNDVILLSTCPKYIPATNVIITIVKKINIPNFLSRITLSIFFLFELIFSLKSDNLSLCSISSNIFFSSIIVIYVLYLFLLVKANKMFNKLFFFFLLFYL